MNRMVCNPRELTDLWDGNEIGDPFLARFDGRYYLYCSSHGMGRGIKVWTSENMVDFTYYGFCCEDERIFGAYAPEVIYAFGRYYMVTSPVGSGHYLLRADNPTGPFEIIGENYGLAIDGSQFVDDDGKEYFLRASGQGIVLHDMPAPEAIDVNGRVIKESHLGHWTEGPMLVRRNGRYFLTETGNHVLSKGYRVEYRVSDEAPDKGYRAMREPVLLLETRDEFHALGHSSTCVAPDMDSMYIVYHKNILDEWNRPKFRSLNMDRLLFNGDRMYTNATWWAQRAPEQPVFACRAGEGMTEKDGLLWLPRETNATYTAEINLTLTGERAELAFSDCARLTVTRGGEWTLKTPEASQAGRFVAAVDARARMTVKVSLHQGALRLYANNLLFAAAQTALAGGKIGVSSSCAFGFVGFSDVAQGSDEGRARKAIPGAWDAVHAENGCAGTAETERGCLGAVMNKGDTLDYDVTIAHDGGYMLFASMCATKEDCVFRVTCGDIEKTFTAPYAGAADGEGMEKRYLGDITLPAGEHTLSLTCESEKVTLDRVYLYEAGESYFGDVIADGNDVTRGALRVIGHKARKSMLRKFSGFTCAEGYGEAYADGCGRDYAVKADVFMQPVSPDACAAIYLRCRLASWHPHQIASARYAYCVRILPDRIELCKQEYGEKILATATLDIRYPATLSLLCRVQGSNVTVSRITENGEQLLIDVTDPFALPCGGVGLDARGDGVGFRYLSVDP